MALISDTRFDVRIFELLPLYLKAEVMEKGLVVYSEHLSELYEYFYFYRKLWSDHKHRQTLSREEAMAMLGRAPELKRVWDRIHVHQDSQENHLR